MCTLCFKSLMIVVFFLTSTNGAYAQPLVTSTESIDSIVINADLVFVATIDKIDGEERVEEQDVYHTSISIENVLKQEPSNYEPYRRLQMKIPRSLAVLRDWKQRSARLLIAYDSLAPNATKVIELVPGKMEVLKAEFTLLRNPEDVIHAAQEALRETQMAVRRLHTFQLQVPRKRIVNTKWAQYHGLLLTVPVNEKLEQRALRSIRSELYSMREEGVRALRYFPSEENIARIKPLLSDSTWSYFLHAQENNGVEVRHYGVRKAAYENLKAWGVDVEIPNIRESVKKSPE